MSSMGMDKSGSQSISANVWTKLTSWVVRSGFPATVITSNALVLDSSSTGDIEFKGTFSNPGGTQQFRVVKNGSIVLGAVANTGVVGTIVGQSLLVGDTLELQAFTNNFLSPNINGGATSTYLEFNQTTTNYSLSASQIIGWNSNNGFSNNSVVSAAQTIVWDSSAQLGFLSEIESDSLVVWDTAADLYQGAHLDIEATQTIMWESAASLLHVPKIVSAPSVFSFGGGR